jgi:lysophospholipase L1-like esterase
MSLRRLAFALSLTVAAALRAAEPTAPARHFSFAAKPAAPTATQVTPDTAFTTARGYGFEATSTAALTATADAITSTQPFYFSAAVPTEGNWLVTVTFPPGTDATVKAELRRLMIERVVVPPGQAAVTRTFLVNTRTPTIAPRAATTTAPAIAAGTVRLKAPRETTQEAWAWDNLITLEFAGPRPAVSAISITPAPAATPTIFLLGDSTVCDQSQEPYNSWGQMFTRWFKPTVAVANHGESGETYRDSLGRRRLDKILSVMKPGDWLLMQFGHNDQKQIAAKSGGPFTTYQAEIKKHVDAVRAHGGTPVILSPMERRGFDAAGKVIPSLADYADRRPPVRPRTQRRLHRPQRPLETALRSPRIPRPRILPPRLRRPGQHPPQQLRQLPTLPPHRPIPPRPKTPARRLRRRRLRPPRPHPPRRPRRLPRPRQPQLHQPTSPRRRKIAPPASSHNRPFTRIVADSD